MKRSAVIFDVDGTLTKPYLDFDAIRAEIGVDGPILEAMAGMDAESRRRAEKIVVRHEREAAENATLQEGAVEVVAACRASGHPVAILTRNSRPTISWLLERHHIVVDAMRTREDGAVKPSPEPVLALCRELEADPRCSWVVGDFLFDVLSGKQAGTRTVLMVGDNPLPEFADQADHVVRRLHELLPLISGSRHAASA